MFDIKTDSDIYYTSGSVPTFTNAGTLRKSAGTGTETVVGVNSAFYFVNSGTIETQTGVLNFASNNTFNSGSAFTGAGATKISSGAALSGSITSANLELAGGTFTGVATLTGATTWSGGSISGGGTAITIPSGSTMTIANPATISVSQASLIDQGSIVWTGNHLYLNDAGQLTIQGGGLFDIRTGSDIYYTSGSVPTFTNAGTLRKSVATGETVIGASTALNFNNTGVRSR